MTDAKLIVFDLGGVLVEIARDWEHACQLAGTHFPREEGPLAYFNTLRPLVVRHNAGEITTPQFISEILPDLPGWSEMHIERAISAWLIGLYDGVELLLDELHRAGFKTACLSNTIDTHWKTLTQTERFHALLKLDWRFASQEINAVKPDEKAYRHVEQETGFGSREILFFDDLQDNIDAAKNLGWRAHLIARDGKPVNQIRQFIGI